MTGESGEEETEELADEIVEESRKMGDRGARTPPEGKKCERCDRDAVPGPGNKWLCREHQKEFFRERHG